jgi:hypothetical protein
MSADVVGDFFGYMAAGVVDAVGATTTVVPGDRVYAGRTWGAHRELIDTDVRSVSPSPTSLVGSRRRAPRAVPPLELPPPSRAPTTSRSSAWDRWA